MTAFTFDSLTGLPRPVPHSELKKLDCLGPGNNAGAARISHAKLLRIVLEGLGERTS